MNLDHDFVQVSKLGEDQKKRSSPKLKHFFWPNSGEDQKKRSSPRMEHFFSRILGRPGLDAHQSQIIGRDTVKLFGGYIFPRISAPLLTTKCRRDANLQNLAFISFSDLNHRKNSSFFFLYKGF